MKPADKWTEDSRRDVLKYALALMAGGSCLASPTSPELSFPTEAQKRLAVTSYPFRTLIESPTNPARDRSKPGMDLKEFPAMIVKRFGVVNINPVGDHLSSTDPAYLDSFRESVHGAGSHLVDLGVGGRDFSNADSAIADEAIAFGRKWVDIAAVLGSPSIRQHLRTGKGLTPSVDVSAQNLGKLAEYGAKKGVIINLENDSLTSEDPFFIVSVLKKVDNPFLRGLPDFGNSIRDHDAAYNRRAVEGMLEYAYNMCHVKDVLRTPDGTVYRVDLPGMFQLAKASSFKGYFSMEFDTAAGDPFTGTENLVRQSLRYLSAS
jgi:sugar phosphate isomerase/epimerase